MNRIAYLAAVSATALAVSFTTSPSLPQVIVFDPNNYAQNVLSAARALQQINNQITSLQNQAQMLINQAKNLANLPFSSLRQLQSSIQRTQQLLSQAQRIAYDIGQIDRAFSTTYAPASAGASSQALVSNAKARWQTSVAALQDALRVQAGVVSNLDTNRTQMTALVTSSQSATGALQAAQAGNQLAALQAQQLADLTAAVAAQGRAQSLEAAQRTSYARSNDPFSNLGKLQISVEVSSVIRASPASFRVAWIQRVYENGSLSATERWTAILTVVIDTPRDADRLRKNPLGVYVNAINWSKELGQ